MYSKCSVFLSIDDRQCYACGSNSKGQLGVGQKVKHLTTPKPLVDPLENKKIKKVACGWEHTMVITGRMSVTYNGDYR